MVFGQVQVKIVRYWKPVNGNIHFYYWTIFITLLYVDRFRRCYRPRKTVQHQTCNKKNVKTKASKEKIYRSSQVQVFRYKNKKKVFFGQADQNSRFGLSLVWFIYKMMNKLFRIVWNFAVKQIELIKLRRWNIF